MKTNAGAVRSIGVAFGTIMIGCISLWAQQAPAQMPGLRALVTDGMRPAVKNLTAQIERFTGRRLEADLEPEYSISLRDQITKDDAFDVAILTEPLLDDMIKQGRIAADSRVELGRSGIGIGVRAATPKPDISTPEAVKRTLLNAKFVSYRGPGIIADLNDKIFERLGIVEEMKPKLMLEPVSKIGTQKKVAEGNGGLVLALSPEVAGPGVDFVGALPGELQSDYIYFVGGVPVNSHDPQKAKELLRFLTTPAAAPTLKSVGIELN